MRRFQFRQESLLKVKQQMRRQAEIKLLQSQGRLDIARRNLAALYEELQALQPPRESAAANPATVWRWVSASQSVQHHFRRAQQEVLAAQRYKHRCAENLRALEADVESLQSLRDQQWTAYKKSNERRQEWNIDDVALRQWLTTKDSTTEGESR